MIEIKYKEQCCGCEACVQSCPKNCIKMERDTEGFLYPKVNSDICINCGLCETVCPFKHNEKHAPVIDAEACINVNDEERSLSSSGGVFSLLAKEIIQDGGVVFGMRMTDDCKEAIFYMAENESQLSSLRGSKYVQGRVDGVYKKVKEELLESRTVMFTGTPCQINGLKLYLKKDYDNLICIDIICHGVPSPLLWQKYTQYTEDKNKSKLLSVNFRSKEEKSNGYGISMDFTNGRHIYINKEYDEYMQMFLKNLSLRPSCYNCKAKTYRLSDITLGDLWKAEIICPDFNDSKGISFVISRSQKGRALINKVDFGARRIAVSYTQSVKFNPSNYQSVKIIPDRNEFFIDLNKMKFKDLANKYVFTSAKSKLKKQLDNIGIMDVLKKIKN